MGSIDHTTKLHGIRRKEAFFPVFRGTLLHGLTLHTTRSVLQCVTVWRKHYQGLGTCSVDTAFDDSWKEEVDKKVSEFSSMTADGEECVR